jgi:hypothetical protein
MQVSVAETEVELTVATRDEEHCEALLAKLQDWGYPAERVK